MKTCGGQMRIRQAREEDVMQIAEILVEDWQNAYRGIIDGDFLDSFNAEQRYQIEIRRYQKYTVAVENDEVLGYAWNETADDEAADCEIIALYVRYSKRNRGIGKALMQHSMDCFRKAGKKSMIIWCLRDNHEARKFYENMGGKEYKDGTHRWGNRDYAMISYLYPLNEQEEAARAIIRATETWQQAGAYYVRIQAMAKKHHITLREEFDERDGPGTKYIVITDHDFPIATARLYPLDKSSVMIGRVVVLPEYRHQGIGSIVVTECERWAEELGYSRAVVESRDNKIGFYEKLMYEVAGEPVDGETFRCIRMEKKLHSWIEKKDEC